MSCWTVRTWSTIQSRRTVQIAKLIHGGWLSRSGPNRGSMSEEEQLFSNRIRDLHDVFHVLTGYGRDLRGESAVLAFTIPQTRNTASPTQSSTCCAAPAGGPRRAI